MEPDAVAERRAELRLEAGKRAPKNVAFLDATFSVQKSITVLHTAFEAREVKARGAAERVRAELADREHRNRMDAPAASGAPASEAAEAEAGAVGPGSAERLVGELAAAEAEADAWADHRRAGEDAIWAGNQYLRHDTCTRPKVPNGTSRPLDGAYPD